MPAVVEDQEPRLDPACGERCQPGAHLVSSDFAVERVPGAPAEAVREVRQRFVPPEPGGAEPRGDGARSRGSELIGIAARRDEKRDSSGASREGVTRLARQL